MFSFDLRVRYLELRSKSIDPNDAAARVEENPGIPFLRGCRIIQAKSQHSHRPSIGYHGDCMPRPHFIFPSEP